MQKREEEGPHLAEVYRIKMWLRCLTQPPTHGAVFRKVARRRLS
jgi:hypothetical protein